VCVGLNHACSKRWLVQPDFVAAESQRDSRTRAGGPFGYSSMMKFQARQLAGKAQAIVLKHANLTIIRFQAQIEFN
jgi:hypothetical protein